MLFESAERAGYNAIFFDSNTILTFASIKKTHKISFFLLVGPEELQKAVFFVCRAFR